MNTINNPASRVYYIGLKAGAYVVNGYVDPGQSMTCPLDGFETFTTEADMVARLAVLSAADVAGEVDLGLVDDATARTVLRARVNKLRAQKLELHIPYMGHPFDADLEAVRNLNGIIAMVGVGAQLPSNFSWRAADNVGVPMDKAQLVGLAAAMMVYRNACYQASWAIKAAIDAAADPRSISLETGWPTP